MNLILKTESSNWLKAIYLKQETKVRTVKMHSFKKLAACHGNDKKLKKQNYRHFINSTDRIKIPCSRFTCVSITFSAIINFNTKAGVPIGWSFLSSYNLNVTFSRLNDTLSTSAIFSKIGHFVLIEIPQPMLSTSRHSLKKMDE